MLLVLGWGKARSRALGTADPAWEPEGDERSWTRTSQRMQRSHWKCSSVKPSAVWSEVNPAALEGSSWSSALHLWLHKLPPAFLHLHLSLALRELQGQPGAEGQEKGRKASGKTETGFLPFCFTTNPPILETKLINTAQSPQLLPALDQLSAHSEGSKPWMKALRGKLGCLTGGLEQHYWGSTMMTSLTKIICSSFDLEGGKKSSSGNQKSVERSVAKQK